MGSDDADQDVPAWGGAIQSAIHDAGEEDDEEGIDVLSGSGLSATGGADDEEELPYVILLHAAVSAIKAGQISEAEFIEGVSKLDVIADNALKVYEIPAVKKDLPGKLTEHQNDIVSGLEAEIHRLKEGLTLMLSYPSTKDVAELDAGLQLAVGAMHASAEIQKKADAERAAITEREKKEKAARAQKAAAADSDD